MLLLVYYLEAKCGDRAAALFIWGSLARKLYMPLTIFRGYSTAADAVALLLWGGAIATMFGVTRLRGIRRDWLPFGVAVLATFYLVLPFQFRSTTDADSRLLPAVIIGVVACLGTLPLHRLALGAALLALCLVVRYGSIIRAWDRLSDRLAVHAQTFEIIETGSRVLPVLLNPLNKENPEGNFLCWAVIRKGAFVPQMFASPDQQPLRLTLHSPNSVACGPNGYWINAAQARLCFDYAWVYNPEGRAVHIPEEWRCLYSVNALTLWQIR